MPFFDLIKTIGWPFAYFSAIFGVFFWIYRDLENSPQSLKIVSNRLRNSRTEYRNAITRCLDWVDDKLSPQEITLFPRNSHRVNWSVDLLSFSLALALAYPIYSLLGNWVGTGLGEVGGLTVIPDEPRVWRRITTIIAMALAGLLMLAAFRLSDASDQAQKNGQQSQSFALWIAVAVATTGAIAAALTGANVVVLTGTFAVIVAGVFQVAVAGASAVAVAVIFAGAVAVAFNVAGGGAGLLAIAGAIFCFLLVLWSTDKFEAMGRPTAWPLFAYAVATIAGIITAVVFSPELFQSNNQDPAGVILFLGLFPLINGLFDYWSSGITRASLRWGVNSNKSFYWSALIDIAAAITLFFILGVTLLLLVHHVHPQNDEPLLNLTRLFNDLYGPDKDWSKHWWLFIMMFSTLIPTCLHGFIALTSTYTLGFDNWTTRIIANLAAGKTDKVAGRWGRMQLSCVRTITVFAPLLAAMALWQYGHYLIQFVIWLFYSFAVFFEIIDTSVMA